MRFQQYEILNNLNQLHHNRKTEQMNSLGETVFCHCSYVGIDIKSDCLTDNALTKSLEWLQLG